MTAATDRLAMKAIVQVAYGSPGGFELREIEKPVLTKDDRVLVRVHAAALNAGDVFIMRGVPRLVRLVAGWPKPKNYVPGWDVAGHVEEVGKNVRRLRPGDAVFGATGRACAEFVSAKESELCAKPGNLSLEAAAAVATAGVTALRALRDVGKLEAGQSVLVNGASGGVGTFAVQIAKKALGASEVTGVCSTKKMDLVRRIGADHVIDYSTRGESLVADGGRRYDLILDHAANHSIAEWRRALTPRGLYVANSGHGGLRLALKALVLSPFVRQVARPFVVAPGVEDLEYLKGLIEAGKVTPVIDPKAFSLRETAEAIRYLAEGRAMGKVVIRVEEG